MTASTEENVLVSIIVPVYNSERTISRCIDSVIHQSYSNIQIIIIDDGSSDNSFEICSEYAHKDIRIYMEHITNSGISAARNAGLKIAGGEYITFIDSDDYVAQNHIQKMIDNIRKHHCDMAVCAYFIVDQHGRAFTYNRENQSTICSSEELLRKIYLEENVKGFLWNKLFRKSLFDNYCLQTDMELLEDLYVITELLGKPLRIIYDPTATYYYCYSSTSIVRNIDRLFDETGKSKYSIGCEKINMKLANFNDSLKSYIRIEMLNRAISLLQKCHKADCHDTNRKKLLLNDIKISYKDYFSCTDIPRLAKLKKFVKLLLIYSKTKYMLILGR